MLQLGVRQDPEYKVTCDYLHGCRYNLPKPSTPAPYQLICDQENGCHYTGVTAPPPEPAPRSLPAPKPEQFKAFVEGLSHVKLPDLPKFDLSKLQPPAPALPGLPFPLPGLPQKQPAFMIPGLSP